MKKVRTLTVVKKALVFGPVIKACFVYFFYLPFRVCDVYLQMGLQKGVPLPLLCLYSNFSKKKTTA